MKLTDRDRLALKMMPTIWAHFQNDGTAERFDLWRQGVVIEAYKIADEMILFIEEERKK